MDRHTRELRCLWGTGSNSMPDFVPGSCHPPYLNGVSVNTQDPPALTGPASQVKTNIFWGKVQFYKPKINILWIP